MSTIYPLRLGKTTAYLVAGERGCILVDTGPQGVADHIIRAVNQTECADLTAVVLTHTHYDHTRSLAALCSRMEFDVVVHTLEAESLQSGYTPLPLGTSFFPKLFAVMAATFNANISRYIGVSPTIQVDEELDLADFGIDGRVLHTPGHTAGSVSVVLESGAALVGDTLFHLLPGRLYPPFANLPAQLLESWKKLLATDSRIFYPAHGRPITREQFEKAAALRIQLD